MLWVWVSMLMMLSSAVATAGPLAPGASPARYYHPVALPLEAQSREPLRAEPPYVGNPRYGRLRLGNGADTSITAVVDESPEAGVFRVYVDANNDEDLTNDGEIAWRASVGQQIVTTVTVTVDYRTGGRLHSGGYAVTLYRMKNRPPETLYYYRGGAMRGRALFGAREHEVALIDDDQDGLYSDLGDGVCIVIDRNDDGRLDGRPGQCEAFAATDPFNVDGVTYRVAEVSDSGDRVAVRPACEWTAPVEYLDPGFAAPDFETTDLDGEPLRLRDFRGKTTVLQFLSSESGLTPNLAEGRRIWAENGRELAVVNICLDEDPEAARRCIEASPFAGDPAGFTGLGDADPVAKRYRAEYLPMTLVIDSEGVIRSRGGGALLWNALVTELGWVDGLPCAIVGKPAPDFEVVDAEGRAVRLSDYRGKVVLVDFWSSWCAPCKAEMPNLIAAYEKHHAKGFEILGVSLDTEREAMDKYLATMPGITWRQVCTERMWEDPTAELYGVLGIPSAFLVDAEGVLYGKVRGPQVEAGLNELLGE